MKGNTKVIAILMLIFFAACGDGFLEEETNPNALTTENFWQSEEDALKDLQAFMQHCNK